MPQRAFIFLLRSMVTLVLPALGAVALLVAATAPIQHASVPAPPSDGPRVSRATLTLLSGLADGELIAPLGLSAARVAEVAFEGSTGEDEVLELGLDLFGVDPPIEHPTTLLLPRRSLLAAPEQFVWNGIDAGEIDAITSAALYVGGVEGEARSAAAALRRGNRLRAIIVTDRGAWSIEPHPAAIEPDDGRHVMARWDGLLATPLICAVTADEIAVPPPVPPSGAPPEREITCIRTLPLTVEVDAAFTAASGDPVRAADDARLLVALADAVLERRAGVRIELRGLEIGAAAASEPDDSVPVATPPLTIAAQYGDLWSRRAVQRDDPRLRGAAALLISGTALEPIDGLPPLGLAWVGGIAGGPAQRCVVANVAAAPSLLARSTIVLHGLGHLLGAAHCQDDGCGTMARRWEGAPLPMLDALAVGQIGSIVHAAEALPAPRPAAPTALSAVEAEACAGVRLSWNAVEGADRYEVFRGEAAESVKSSGIATSPTPTYVDADAPIGVPLVYQVVAHSTCAAGEASPSVEFTRRAAPAEAPRQVQATDGVGCGEIVVTWTPVEGAHRYLVFRNTVNNANTAEEVGVVDQTRFVDGAPRGAVQWYWVRALDACDRRGPVGRGESGFIGGLAPPPTGVSATDGDACDSIVVSWNPVAGATSYSIWRGTTADASQAAPLAIVEVSPYEDPEPPIDVELHYFVGAITACGAGPFGGPDVGRAASAVPRIAAIGDAVIPCGEPFHGAAPKLLNAACADPVQWRLERAPSGATIALDGSVSWGAPVPGTHEFVVLATNERGIGRESWMLDVVPSAPSLGAAGAGAMTEPVAAVTVPATCGSPLRMVPLVVLNPGCAPNVGWSVEAGPEGVSIEADGAIAWPAPRRGEHAVTVMARTRGGVSRAVATIAVVAVAPQLEASRARTIRAGTPFVLAPPTLLSAACAEPVTFTAAPLPEGVTLVEDGSLTWPLPTAGSHRVIITARGPGGESETALELNVLAPAAPVLAAAELPPGSCGVPWSSPVAVIANPVQAGTVRWSVRGAAETVAGVIPPTINEHGTLRVERPQPGTIALVVVATNDVGATELPVVITVAPTVAPVITAIPDGSGTSGAAYIGPTPTLVSTECVGPVAWSLVEAPDGVTIDAVGVVRWEKPTVGRHRITIAAIGGAGRGQGSWSIEVVEPEPGDPDDPDA